MSSFFTDKRILVTGASGFIGSALCRTLSASGARVRGLSRKIRPAPDELSCEWICGDIQDLHIWQKALEDIDIVFHLAAQTSASYADQNPDEDYKLNVLPVQHLIQSAHPVQTVIFSGTATQYGIPKSLPADETHPDSALTAYDHHKQAAESLLLQASQKNLLKACSLRLCTIYGPGPAASASDRGVLNQMLARALRGDSLMLYPNADCLRDFLYLEDCVQAFMTAAEKINEVKDKAYLIGSGTGHSIAEAAGKIANLIREKKIRNSVKIEQPLSPSPLMEIEKRNFIADSSKFARETGWQPHYSLDRGLASMLENFLCAS